jgi:hypothetical protein
MINLSRSFFITIAIHGLVFFISTIWCLRFNQQTTNKKNIKIIRLVSFGIGKGFSNETGHINAKNDLIIDKVSGVQASAKISDSESSVPKSPISNISNSGSANNTNQETHGFGNGNFGSGFGDGQGIDQSIASQLEIEINRLRIYLQSYLDKKIDLRNIQFNVQLIAKKESGLTDIEIISNDLNARHISIIKKVISNYRSTELINKLPAKQLKIIIPIKIVDT